MIHGRNLIVYLDGVAIAGVKSCQYELSRQFLQTCSPTEAQVLDKVPTLYDWSVSCDGLIPASSLTVGLEDKLIEGTKCLLTFTDGSGNNRAGFVYVKSCRESGAVGSLATFSASFESTGALYKYTDYEAASFTGGDDLAIITTSSGVYYDFQPQGTGTMGAQITAASPGYVIVFADDNWVLLSMSLNSVQAAIGQEDSQSLSQAEVDYGDGNATVQIAAGTYTFLIDGHSNLKKIRLLQK